LLEAFRLSVDLLLDYRTLIEGIAGASSNPSAKSGKSNAGAKLFVPERDKGMRRVLLRQKQILE